MCRRERRLKLSLLGSFWERTAGEGRGREPGGSSLRFYFLNEMRSEAEDRMLKFDSGGVWEGHGGGIPVFGFSSLVESILCVVFSHFCLSSPASIPGLHSRSHEQFGLGVGRFAALQDWHRRDSFCVPWGWLVPNQLPGVYRDEPCGGGWEQFTHRTRRQPGTSDQ